MAQKNAVVDHNTLASSWGPISAHNALAGSWGPYQAGVAQQKAIDQMMVDETAARLAQQNSATNEELAAAGQVAKNMALARTLGPDTGLLAGQAQLEQQAAAANQLAQNVNKTFTEQFSPTETTTASTPFQEVATSQNMGVNQGLIDQAAQIAAAKARWAGMDESQQRDMRASAGKPDMGSMLEAMAQQQALANLSAAGGMEFGGLLGEAADDEAGGTGQRGMFGGEVGYGPGR